MNLRFASLAPAPVLAALLIAGCGSHSSPSGTPDAGHVPPPLVAARPYGFKAPATYDPKTPAPLVIVLHGYGAYGWIESGYLRYTTLSDTKGFLLAYPDGTLDSTQNRYWNATDACCNFDHTNVDDVAYVSQVIDDVSAQYNVDPKRIFLIGHSNGAFLAHRIACELSGRIAAIITLAGMQWLDATKCSPTVPVAVLQVHGDADAVILYAGGATKAGTYPSAKQTLATWAAKNGCTGGLAATGETLDLEEKIAGAESTVERHGGCPASVELWTIKGGSHIPFLSVAWAEASWQFFLANAKK